MLNTRPEYPLFTGDHNTYKYHSKYVDRTIDFITTISSQRTPEEIHQLWHFYNDQLDKKEVDL